jgi:uncharacterized protein with PIN domain
MEEQELKNCKNCNCDMSSVPQSIISNSVFGRCQIVTTCKSICPNCGKVHKDVIMQTIFQNVFQEEEVI